MNQYILDGHEPVLCADLMTWGVWMGANDRHVAATEVGEARVSTVFLGLDHSVPGLDDERQLFETMVFGGVLDGDVRRYATWDEAEAGHAEMVGRVRLAEGVVGR